MPSMIEHIDAIARKKGRGVLFLEFSQDDNALFSSSDWRNVSVRRQVIAWLNQSNIEWSMCGHIANEQMMLSYDGRIYIDVPLDTENPIFQKLSEYLEMPDGQMKISGVKFFYLPLEIAMKNSHHDKPGFWERWGENF